MGRSASPSKNVPSVKPHDHREVPSIAASKVPGLISEARQLIEVSGDEPLESDTRGHNLHVDRTRDFARKMRSLFALRLVRTRLRTSAFNAVSKVQAVITDRVPRQLMEVSTAIGYAISLAVHEDHKRVRKSRWLRGTIASLRGPISLELDRGRNWLHLLRARESSRPCHSTKGMTSLEHPHRCTG